MNINWKSAWAWLCGLLIGPIAVLTPYIAVWNWHFPNEAKGGALLALLGGLGLVNMIRPQDHKDP